MDSHVLATLQNLQNDIKAFQKKAKKDKLSKKDTDAQVQSMEAAVKARHEEELAALESDELDDAAEHAAAAAPAEAAPPAPAKPQGPTKAQRRRVRSASVCSCVYAYGSCDHSHLRLLPRKQEKLKKQEQERRERIEEENKHTVSERQIEADIIARKLAPLGLAMKDIPSDGHCMYHAVADQMKLHGLPISTSVRPSAQCRMTLLCQSLTRAHVSFVV